MVLGVLPSSSFGRPPRYDEYDKAKCLSWANSSGTSLTTKMPRESGPKASCRVSNETLPIWTV